MPAFRTFGLSGTADKLRQAWDALRWNLLLALAITYLLMAALFESFLYPFVILFSVPLAALGGFVGAIAVATADTWGTEIGVLSQRQPRNMLSGQRVPRESPPPGAAHRPAVPDALPVHRSRGRRRVHLRSVRPAGAARRPGVVVPAARHRLVVTIEDGLAEGGIGSTIAQGMAFGTGSAIAHRAA